MMLWDITGLTVTIISMDQEHIEPVREMIDELQGEQKISADEAAAITEYLQNNKGRLSQEPSPVYIEEADILRETDWRRRARLRAINMSKYYEG